MESNIYHDQESTNSNDQEVVSHDQSNDLGVGRSYECVFCKRGFNTAQALGGHMNIHRKDRARNKPTSSSSSISNKLQLEQVNNNYKLYGQQIIIPVASTHDFSNNVNDHQSAMNHRFATFFPASTSYNYSHHDHQEQLMNDNRLADWRMSLEFPPLDQKINGRQEILDDQKEEMDLELRLGYDS